MSRRLLRTLGMLALVSLCGQPLLGTTAGVRTLRQAALSADWIVEAEVVAVTTDPRPPFPGVWSLVELQVLDQVSGAALPDTITLHAPGGRVGGDYRIVVGAPYFYPKDRYVLLLRDWNRTQIVLEHVTQATFRLHRAPSGEWLVPNDLARRGLLVERREAELSRDELVRMLLEARGQ